MGKSTLFRSDRMLLGLNAFEPGQEQALHPHVAMDKVEFHQPVYVGDVVSFWPTLLQIGRTSITMYVMVETDRHERTLPLSEAEVTYVSVDLADRSPVALSNS